MKPARARFALALAVATLLFGCRADEAPARQPRRIVALAPSLTETLFALGLGDRVVGVGNYSHWPPEAESRPHLGGLFDPNLERIVSQRPDLAVLLPSERDLATKLSRLGIGTLLVPSESLEDVEHSFTAVAARCGVPAAGARLAAQFRTALRPKARPRPEGGPPLRVLLSVDRQAGRLTDVLVAGPGTFLDELLTRLGAINVFADARMRYPQVALEEVLARAPDLILELRGEPLAPAAAERLAGDWRQLPGATAASRVRVAVVAGDYVVIPGPRLPRLYREMAAALAGGGGTGAGP